MQRVSIGLIGCGTVGTGVARLLMDNQAVIHSRTGIDVALKYVADIDAERVRQASLPANVFTTDAMQVVDDPEVGIIVEMVGGETFAKDLILAAFDRGKHVVTANKALLAAQGGDLIQSAADKGVDLAFEAAIGGCMPIVKTLRESLVGNHINAMTGILNGTCNYILSKITDEGIDFDTALKQAQQSGFAEADPTLDVEGLDAAHKITLLSSLAYGMKPCLDEVYTEGISRITPLDITYANEFGYRIKLLAISKFDGDSVQIRVHPTMIPFTNPLSNVNGSLNAITVSGDAISDIMLYGHGAGMMPTASAVVGDIVDLARNIIYGSVGRVPILSHPIENIRPIPVMPVDHIVSHYYFRFSALDQPGVLSKIAGVLGHHGISIQSVQQKGRKSNGAVPVVMLIHRVEEVNVKRALEEIEKFEVVDDTPMVIRIEDDMGA